jgi:hypothetical protein
VFEKRPFPAVDRNGWPKSVIRTCHSVSSCSPATAPAFLPVFGGSTAIGQRETVVCPLLSCITAEQMELSRLRTENAKLRMECEILKKATAYFAKDAL